MTDSPARLSTATLERARAACTPHYDRAGEPSIVHVGLGAFARAHLGVYANDLLAIGGPGRIRGVSLHSRRSEEQLAPQDGLYTVAEREPGVDEQLRVVGSITSVRTGTAAALAALTAPTTTIVTLTVTEKGYELQPEDRERPERPSSPSALLALALAQWRAAGRRPPVIASLDNVSGNGAVLRSLVIEIAGALDPGLAAWVHDHVRFPGSVVDRMTPAPTPQDVTAITARLGLVDLAAVAAEKHRSWFVGADENLEPFARVGVELVDDVTPLERRKLWLLNGPHSALAYAGLLAGCATIADAARHVTVSAFVRRLVDDILEVVALPNSVHPKGFALDAQQRFRNPSLGHTCVQVAADGSRKLPQRFGSPVHERTLRGLDTMRFAMVVAAWIAAVGRLEVRGVSLPPVEDPESETLQAPGARDLELLAHTALDGRFGDPFTGDVARALEQLVGRGIHALEALA